MIFSVNLQKAIRFAIKTHEVYQKQKRKGKDIPYIVHPLTVGLILAESGASEEVIIAGLLHDTIEDSNPETPVTKELINERFGEKVTELVLAVTENTEIKSWRERKDLAFEHLKKIPKEALLIKTADLLSNINEIGDDWDREGDKVFKRFSASKEDSLNNYLRIINLLEEIYPENPLAEDLNFTKQRLLNLFEPRN